jgi:hypothetical protein
MITSLLTTNPAKITRPFIRTQFLPGTGRCPNGAEGAQVGHKAVQVESWDPSVASRHLPETSSERITPPSVLRTATSPSELWEDFWE